jgi:hypothetical protein
MSVSKKIITYFMWHTQFEDYIPVPKEYFDYYLERYSLEETVEELLTFKKTNYFYEGILVMYAVEFSYF